MLTLRHFLDRPTWAAAAGYDFNYLDCLSFSARLYNRVFSALSEVLRDFPETQVKELPLTVLIITAAIAGVIVWPYIFWIVAFLVRRNCLNAREKYKNDKSERVKQNLAIWIKDCKRKWERENQCF